MPDGPATRPITPLAVENGVGKPAAPEKGAPNAGAGKRARRTPIPNLSLSDRKVGQGLIVFASGLEPGHLPASAVRAPEVAIRRRVVGDFQTGVVPLKFFSRNADGDGPQQNGFGHGTGLGKM